MCLSCGCFAPNNRHSNASITLDDIVKASEEAGVSPIQCYQYLLDGFNLFYSAMLDEELEKVKEQFELDTAQQIEANAKKTTQEQLDKIRRTTRQHNPKAN